MVDPRRTVRDATAEALLRALPGVRDASGAIPRAFRPLRLTFDRARPFQAVRVHPCACCRSCSTTSSATGHRLQCQDCARLLLTARPFRV